MTKRQSSVKAEAWTVVTFNLISPHFPHRTPLLFASPLTMPRHYTTADAPLHVSLVNVQDLEVVTSNPYIAQALRSVHIAPCDDGPTAPEQTGTHIGSTIQLLQSSNQLRHLIFDFSKGSMLKPLCDMLADSNGVGHLAPSVTRFTAQFAGGTNINDMQHLVVLLPSLESVHGSVALAVDGDEVGSPGQASGVLDFFAGYVRCPTESSGSLNIGRHTLGLKADLSTPLGQDVPNCLLAAVRNSRSHLSSAQIRLSPFTPVLPPSVAEMLAPCSALRELELPCSSLGAVQTIRALLLHPDATFRLQKLVIRCFGYRFIALGGMSSASPLLDRVSPALTDVLVEMMVENRPCTRNLRKLVLHWFQDALPIDEGIVRLCRTQRVQLCIPGNDAA